MDRASWRGQNIFEFMVVNMTVLRIWICMAAVLVGLPLKADSTVFERRPGITCGVRGGEAHLVWNYDDSAETVNVILWFDGTEATGTPMGVYVTGNKDFTPYGSYIGRISFTSPVYTAGSKGAKLTFNGLEASDAGNYTTVFQANADTSDTAVLQVAEQDGLGEWEICFGGSCKAISYPLSLPASGSVKVHFTKNGTLTCDMDINVTPSVGPYCHLKDGVNLTAGCDLGDAATLLAAGTLSIDLAFGKNGEVFYTDNHTIADISVISGGQSPSPAQAAAIAFGVIFIIVGIILVAVVLFKGNKKAGLKLADKVCVGVGVGLCVIGCILVVVFVAALAYLTSAEIAGACVAVCVVTVVILIVIVVVWYKMKAPSVEGGANGTPMQKSPDDRVTKPTHAHDVGNGGDVAARPLPSRPAGRLSPLHNSVTPENQENDPTRSKRKHKKEKKSKKSHREDEDYRGTEEV